MCVIVAKGYKFETQVLEKHTFDNRMMLFM